MRTIVKSYSKALFRKILGGTMAAMVAVTSLADSWSGLGMTVHAEEAVEQTLYPGYSTMVWSGDAIEGGKDTPRSETDWSTEGQYGQYHIKTTADDSDTRMIYLKWDLSGITLEEEDRVTVRLCHNGGANWKASTVSVYPCVESVNGNWADVSDNDVNGTITWENRPIYDIDKKIAEFTMDATGITSQADWKFISFDVTGYVRQLIETGHQYLSIVLRGDDDTYQFIRSPRSGNPQEHWPVLIVAKAGVTGGEGEGGEPQKPDNPEQPDEDVEKPDDNNQKVGSQELVATESTMVWSDPAKKDTNWADGEYGQLYLRSTSDDSDTRLNLRIQRCLRILRIPAILISLIPGDREAQIQNPERRKV